MPIISLIFLFVFGVNLNAADNPENLRIDIDLTIDRDAKGSWDIHDHVKNKKYGTRILDKKEGVFESHPKKIEYKATKNGTQRDMEITICIGEKNTLFPIKKKPLFVIKKSFDCIMFEKIKFSFQPGEVIIMKSKVEHDSRYEIIINEHTNIVPT